MSLPSNYTPQSRVEEILVAMINGEEYTKFPESRIEALLIELLGKIIEVEGRGAYEFKGSVDFDELPETLTEDMAGWTYNMAESFTTDNRFVDGAGKVYPQGTNVSIANVGTDEDPDMMFDVPSAFVDVSAIYASINKVIADIAPEFSIESPYHENDLVIYNEILYIFTTDHAAGEFNPLEVEQTDISTLLTSVYNEIDLLAQSISGISESIPRNLSDLTEDSTHKTVTDTEKSTWNAKQDALTFDDNPTASSNNPVKSGGVYAALSGKQDNIGATKDSNNNVIFSGDITDGDGNTLSEVVKAVTKIYGFHISAVEGEPSAKVTYLADAVGHTPAGMDYVNDRFDYGSWKDVFFMPKPCMLKQDGTVDYYLDPNDYSKKADGTASDVANPAYNGNAMMEWPKIYMKIVPDEGDPASYSCYISNKQVDTDYHAWPYIDANGVEKEHFYTAIYNSKVVDGVARSLSGQTGAIKSKTASQELEALRANNASGQLHWDMETYADRMLVINLAILISKTTDSQTAFGKGLSESGSEAINDTFITGVHNTKGLFYGTNSGAASTYTNANKIFGMENYICFQWRRLQGLVIDNGVIKTKLCYGQSDGSTADDYSFDATGYVEGASLSTLGDTNGQCNKVVASDRGFVPYHAATPTASSSTYYCDYHWIELSDKRVPLVGGASGNGAACGLFCFALVDVAAAAYWSLGAALSCR